MSCCLKSNANRHHWIAQRLTAILVSLLAAYFLYHLNTITTADHTTLIEWLRQPLNTGAVALFVLSSFWHGKMGIEIIIGDYVHNPSTEKATQCLNLLAFTLCGIGALYALYRVTFGA
jgi:succinate dehydrogenase / fumarate reductase membrane anchor subunit